MKKLMLLMVMVFTSRMGISQSQIVVPATTYQEESKKAAQAKTADTLTNSKRNTNVPIFGRYQRKETEKTYEIGLQALVGNTICWGFCVGADVNPKTSIQIIIAPFGPEFAPFGDPKIYIGKVIYKIKKNLYWNWNIYGALSASDYYEEETFIFGVWGGTGIEFNWKILCPKFPSIAWNLGAEIGANSKGIAVITEIGLHHRF